MLEDEKKLVDLSNVATEQPSLYTDLDKMTTEELVSNINHEDKKVAEAVEKALPQISAFVDALVSRIQAGGRVFQFGSGTSGRLAVVDASEILPTFGEDNLFVGLIAGGDGALRRAVEGAEDDIYQGRHDLQKRNLTEHDVILGLATSGRTPYVLHALEKAQQHGLLTGSIVCSPDSPVAQVSDFSIEVLVGPEFVTGSTRMKSGTAQKMVLNIISTTTMIKLGKVIGNKMNSLTPTNEKLVSRAVQTIVEYTGLSLQDALAYLQKYGNPQGAIDAWKGNNAEEKSGEK